MLSFAARLAAQLMRTMGRRVVFGIDIKPHLRRYVLVKLRQANPWDTPFGYELVHGIEQPARVKFLVPHPDERASESADHVRFMAWLPVRQRYPRNGGYHDGFWLSERAEGAIREHINTVFASELYAHVAGAEKMERAVQQFIDRYSLAEDGVDMNDLRMVYYRLRKRVRRGASPALLRGVQAV